MVRPSHDVTRQASSFVAIGVACTAAYLALFALLRNELAPAWANAVAMLITAIANTSANRRYTFGVRDAAHRVRHHLAGLLTFGTALAITSGALGVMEVLAPRASALEEAAVLLTANLAATGVRFGILRHAVAHRDMRTVA
jgi:putative flippase GtrA